MILDDSSRVQFRVTVTSTVDPSSGTLTLDVDGTDHACTWDGAATSGGGSWVRVAHTNTFFAGPDVGAGQLDGAVVLGYGFHPTELRLNVNGTIVAKPCPAITVRKTT